jgi:hypothetical protein
MVKLRNAVAVLLAVGVFTAGGRADEPQNPTA